MPEETEYQTKPRTETEDTQLLQAIGVLADTEPDISEEEATPASGEVVEEAELISIDEFLAAQQEPVVGYATLNIRGIKRRLEIAALSDEEMEMLLNVAKKRDPKNPGKPPKPNLRAFRLGMIAFSIAKAGKIKGTNVAVVPDQLKTVLSGQLTEIQTKIYEISGFDQSRIGQVESFFD